VGLGNPGPTYRKTRHNVGFRAVEALADKHGISQWRSRFHGLLAEAQSLGALLLLPQTFMNESGASVAACAAYHRIEPERILIVCDDINLPFARLRFRREGSDGGHNGLKSIVAALHTQDFPRLRIGIGRTDMDTIGHVLGTFNRAEEQALPGVLTRAVAGIEAFAQAGDRVAIALVNAYGGDAPPTMEPA